MIMTIMIITITMIMTITMITTITMTTATMIITVIRFGFISIVYFTSAFLGFFMTGYLPVGFEVHHNHHLLILLPLHHQAILV